MLGMFYPGRAPSVGLPPTSLNPGEGGLMAGTHLQSCAYNHIVTPVRMLVRPPIHAVFQGNVFGIAIR